MSNYKEMQHVQTEILRILETSALSQQQKIRILSQIYKSYSTGTPRQQLNWKVFQPKTINVFWQSNPTTPLSQQLQAKEELSDKFQTVKPFSQQISGTESVLNTVKGDIIPEESKVIASFNSVKHRGNKMKKNYVFNSLLKLKQIFILLVESVKKAFSHVAVMKHFEGIKYYIDAVYLRGLNLQLQNLKANKSKQIQDLLSKLIQFSSNISVQLPLIQNQFIKEKDKFKQPSNSELFKKMVLN